MGSLRDSVRRILRDLVAEDYPHIHYPAASYAQVTAKQQSGEAYTYSVRLLDAAGQADHSVPTIPGIKSKLNLDVGDNVAVIFPYGQFAPYIVGKAVIP